MPQSKPPALMIQGTGSDVGKSLVVAGLCRVFARRGLRVRPFKPQNMSNNAAVTADGGEIGRAQALQARACGVDPTVHMNPVLLKPETETGAQVIVQGRRIATLKARDYAGRKPQLLAAVLDSFARLSAEADLVLVEGAGSPAEVNLRAGDIANMGFAEAADLPVVLVADIHRGGVIASLVGTHTVIASEEAARIQGFIINRFRGDAALFADGVRIVEDRTGWRGLGIVPHWPQAARLPAEDANALAEIETPRGRAITVAVPVLSRIANFDDLDPLRLEPDVAVRMVPPGEALPGDADLVLLPGSKSTIGDLAFLRAQGWDIDLAAHVRRGGRVLGLCAGFQMLGRRLHDPDGIDGAPGSADGLGLLDLETVMTPDKSLVAVAGTHRPTGTAIRGYEMHVGRTEGPALVRPLLDLDGRPDGAMSPDGRVAGCYVHGLFAADGFRAAFLAGLKPRAADGLAYDATVDATLDGLANHLERHLDLPALAAIAGLPG
ncbi:cobyric acid synthase [Mycobacterium sp. KBS0706]|uniref:cobyric acid synthase n=1 Tax=Mycobacterium sp. KBS0706 TaxID=2578109 RepID=UPI0027D2475C|nr:cobyric acid synthase [Mycobacterium sp. KBS0706]